MVFPFPRKDHYNRQASLCNQATSLVCPFGSRASPSEEKKSEGSGDPGCLWLRTISEIVRVSKSS